MDRRRARSRGDSLPLTARHNLGGLDDPGDGPSRAAPGRRRPTRAPDGPTSAGRSASSESATARAGSLPAPEFAIVHEDLWKAAHARLSAPRAVDLERSGGRACGRPTNPAESPYVLIGLLRCPSCGGLHVSHKSSHARQQRADGSVPEILTSGTSLQRGRLAGRQRPPAFLPWAPGRRRARVRVAEILRLASDRPA